MANTQVFQASDDVVAREVGGEMVLLDLASGLYFGLDPVGGRVWQALSENSATLDQLVDVIEAEFDAPRAVIEQDLERLLDDLAGRKLVAALVA
jgi:hypothetical protein